MPHILSDLAAFGANDYENDARGNRCASGDWRNRNCFLALCRGLDRSNVEDFFRLRIGDSFRDQSDNAKDNQSDAKDCNESHVEMAACGLPNTLTTDAVLRVHRRHVQRLDFLRIIGAKRAMSNLLVTNRRVGIIAEK